MLNANEPKRYTATEVLVLFRAISKHLKTIPDAFLAQGIFRVSGAQQHIMQIIDDILRHKKFVRPEYTAHDYVGALKYALINGNLLAMDDPAIQTLKAKIAIEDTAIGESGISEFIQSLVNSGDKHRFMVAEIFYEFMYQLTSALAFQDANKMSAVNLGIIAGPFFATLIEDNPKNFLDTTFKFNQISAALIGTDAFKQTFEERFPKAVEASRERELLDMERTRSHFLRRRDKPASASEQARDTQDKKKQKRSDLQIDDARDAVPLKAPRKLFFFHKKPLAKRVTDDEDSSLLSKLPFRRKK